MLNAYTISPVAFAIGVLGLSPYSWQAEVMEAVAMGKKTALVAANGSGKTDGCIAPLALWFLTRYPQGTLVVTSGVYRQVSGQLWPSMRRHARRLPNLQFQPKGTEISTREGGRAVGFSATDAGKAEGWHSKGEDSPLMIIADEAKTVDDGIFFAFDRCYPDFLLYASSPGGASGQHFRCFHEERSLFHTVKATAFDCPHIPSSMIDDMRLKHGEKSSQYRSQILADWTEGDGNLILSPADLRECIDNPPAAHYGTGYKTSGHDFAAGGDEDAIASREGNVITLEEHWRDSNTVRSRRRHVKWCQENRVKEGDAWGDASGAGKWVVQDMEDEGFYMSPFLGGTKSEEPDYYSNLNADAWFGFAAAVRRKEVVLLGITPEAFSQLTTRQQDLVGGKGLLGCEKKEAMKKRGLKSPDLADAIVLAWWSQRYWKPPLQNTQAVARSAPLMKRRSGGLL